MPPETYPTPDEVAGFMLLAFFAAVWSLQGGWGLLFGMGVAAFGVHFVYRQAIRWRLSVPALILVEGFALLLFTLWIRR